MQLRWLLLLIPVGLVTLNGCVKPSASPRQLQPPRERPITVEAQVLYRGIYCGGDASQPTVDWITDPQGLNQFSERLAAQEIQPPDLSQVNFPQEGVLLIAMGQRPSGGYRLALGPEPVEIEADTLRVPITWTDPTPGYAQIQVITNPCLLIQLPAVSFQRIQVIDQHGQVRIETQIEQAAAVKDPGGKNLAAEHRPADRRHARHRGSRRIPR